MHQRTQQVGSWRRFSRILRHSLPEEWNCFLVTRQLEFRFTIRCVRKRGSRVAEIDHAQPG